MVLLELSGPEPFLEENDGMEENSGRSTGQEDNTELSSVLFLRDQVHRRLGLVGVAFGVPVTGGPGADEPGARFWSAAAWGAWDL